MSSVPETDSACDVLALLAPAENVTVPATLMADAGPPVIGPVTRVSVRLSVELFVNPAPKSANEPVKLIRAAVVALATISDPLETLIEPVANTCNGPVTRRVAPE